ncbi:uncharacterized protein LOC136029817 [Artemia franciscana]|uniref:uncharacterized protein LOC136029817 n=1 Tax=Artemia franciscana TaxID=6661 RepID=UPI0032DAE3C4
MDHSQQFDTEDVAEVEKLNPISREPLNLSSQARGDQWETYRTKSYFKSFSTPGTGLPTTSDNKLQRPYSGSEASFSSRSSSTASGEQKPDSYSRNEKSPAESISSKVEKNWPLDLSPSCHYYEEEEEEENIWSNRYRMNDHPFTADVSNRSAENRFQYIYCSHKGSYKRFNSMPSSVAQLQENGSNYHGKYFQNIDILSILAILSLL